jgi:hypothetical protein
MVIVSSAVINVGVQVSLLCADFDSFGYIPKRGMEGMEYGSSTYRF